MKIFELTVLFCLISSWIALLILIDGNLKTTLSDNVSMGLMIMSAFAYIAALLGFIVVTAGFVYRLFSGNALAYVKERILTIINISMMVIMLALYSSLGL